MKKTKVLYWVFTILFSVLMLASAIPDVLSMQVAVEGFRQMGLPAYLVPFIGIAKTLGVVAILIPGYPRLKEWAYAGLVFDLVGATYSIAASNQPLSSWAFMIVPLALAATAYIFYNKKLKADLQGKTAKSPTRTVYEPSVTAAV